MRRETVGIDEQMAIAMKVNIAALLLRLVDCVWS